MSRRRALGGLLTVAALFGIVPASRATPAGSAASPSGAAAARGSSLDIYYTSPVLARAGEQVLMPVQVVCSTTDGRACAARVTLGTHVPGERWHLTRIQATPGLGFDLSAPAARAAARGGFGTVEFFIRAEGPAGASVSIPPAGPQRPLSFAVTRGLPLVRIPGIVPSDVKGGRTVLSLPWGSGPMRAGLEPGRESAAAGPSSFDIDRSGRIYLVDPPQHRLAVFRAGKLVRSTRLDLGADAAIAVTEEGTLAALDRSAGALLARTLDASGASERSAALGAGIVGQVRIVGGSAFGLVLPLDAWVALPGFDAATAAGTPAGSGPFAGEPLPSGGQLIRIARQENVRLAIVTATGMTNAVELRTADRFGEVALAEPDGGSGCWAVLHLWRELPNAADQYRVVHVVGGAITSSFAVANQAFAETPPLSRFRLGGDGNLYQLVSSPSGMRIVRFDLKEGS